MVEPIYGYTHSVQDTLVLGLGLSSEGGVRSRFHASTIVPGSMILTNAVGKQAPPSKGSATTSTPKNRKCQGKSNGRRTGSHFPASPVRGSRRTFVPA